MHVLKPDRRGMTDRRHVKIDGPLSRRIALASLRLGGVIATPGVIAWLVGLQTVGNVLVGAGSGLVSVMIITAWLVERRERRREQSVLAQSERRA
jgi:Flp pilus assembly protein TadB